MLAGLLYCNRFQSFFFLLSESKWWNNWVKPLLHMHCNHDLIETLRGGAECDSANVSQFGPDIKPTLPCQLSSTKSVSCPIELVNRRSLSGELTQKQDSTNISGWRRGVIYTNIITTKFERQREAVGIRPTLILSDKFKEWQYVAFRTKLQTSVFVHHVPSPTSATQVLLSAWTKGWECVWHANNCYCVLHVWKGNIQEASGPDFADIVICSYEKTA